MEENYNDELSMELGYFNRTVVEIEKQQSMEQEANGGAQRRLLSSRQEMWESTAHSSDDFDKLMEFNQSLEPMLAQTSIVLAGEGRARRLQAMRACPYFARVDFTEDGDGQAEPIYIGRGSLMDDATGEIFIYDWRAPIASIFYRFELGSVFYEAPKGAIPGTVSLKRQYEIRHGEFKYYFDANIQIADGFLRKMLAQNASSKMKSIVETIQRDQDIIIRDMENDLLMVQGVAGSGKTSVALHRVAYLMYQGLSAKLSSNSIVILSPNLLFGRYIADVLPELGEENVVSLTFEHIGARVLESVPLPMQTRNQLYELLMGDGPDKARIRSSMEFKASGVFTTMLLRLADEYGRRLIAFEDIYYNGLVIADRHSLKNALLGRDKRIPLAVRLKQMETLIMEKIGEQRRVRRTKLENFIRRHPEHAFEYRQLARLVSIRESNALLARVRGFTEVDCAAIYDRLFRDKALFYRVAAGLELPGNIEQIRLCTIASAQGGVLPYEDMLALAYLKIHLAGCNDFHEIKHVVVDEAQDYYPIHFEILKRLFGGAGFTILGDISQTIGKREALTLYGDIGRILDKKKSALLSMSKSFRCTNEITLFSMKFLDGAVPVESFGRDGPAPVLVRGVDSGQLEGKLLAAVREGHEKGYGTLGILCKNAAEADLLFDRLQPLCSDIIKITEGDTADAKGAFIIPVYLAKGLEFDAVFVYGADARHYNTDEDKKLLYVASTRALHQLSFFYVGEPSRFFTVDINGGDGIKNDDEG